MTGDRIAVAGNFITNSSARGCFIVLECNSYTADIFRALPREGQSVNETIHAPNSNYTVYAYDLEEDLLPYPMPANTPGPMLPVTGNHGT